MPHLRIEQVAVDDVARLRPLWLLLHAHHQAVAPELRPYVDDAASWAVRRDLYAEVLAHGGAAWVARVADADVGYAVLAREPAPWPATFVAPPEVAELETLLVLPDARGRGVGGSLMRVVDAHAASLGLAEACVGVLPQNARAIDLYRRVGYRDTWLVQTRFARPPAVRSPARRVEAVAPDEVDDLESLWRALHAHHRAVAPALGPYLGDAQSWAATRATLVAAAAAGLVLRTGGREEPTGVVCASVSRDEPLWTDTWRTGRDVAEIALLAVAPGERGSGADVALLDALDARLAGLGVRDQAAGALAADARTIELYASRGFRPAWLRLRRPAPAS